MVAAKIFLAVIGISYLLLAAWCAAKPAQTSNAVGFQLKTGSGQSEFLTVYGGLEFGLGLMFLWPLWQAESLPFSLMTCLVVHASLVVFRSVSFVMFSGIPSMTMMLAGTEWVIFLGSAFFWWSRKN